MARALAASICVWFAVLAAPCLAQNQYSNIVVLGDSLSDPGNWPRVFGINYPTPPYYQYQFSNGPVYAKYLNGLFGISAPLEDLAIGGAFSGVGNIAGLTVRPDSGFPNAGVDGEISYYVASQPHSTGRELAIVWAGGNDYLAGSGPALSQAANTGELENLLLAPGGLVSTTVSNLTNDVKRLAAVGLKNFAVVNQPAFGALPDPASPASAGTIFILLDQQLSASISQLQQQLHVNITVIDMSAVYVDILIHPAKYGVDAAHLGDQCIESPTCVSQHLPWLKWDAFHPTDFVHQIYAEVFFASLSGPTTVGSELEIDKIAQRGFFDQISSRAAALRLGATGLAIDNVGGMSGKVGENSDSRISAFLTGAYGWGSQDTRQNVTGFDYRHSAFVGGIDYRAADWLALGGVLGYADTKADLVNAMGSQAVDSYQLGFHATAWSDGWYGSIAGTYAYADWNKLRRNSFVAGQTAAATTGGRTLGARIEGGYSMRWGNISLIPAAELQYAHYRIGSYTESGAVGLNQEVDGQGAESMIGQVGIEAAIQTDIGGYSVIPRLRVGFDHEFRNPIRTIVTRLASQPETFVATDLAPTSDNWARFGAGVDVRLGDAFSALLDFNGIVANGRNEDYAIRVTLNGTF